MRLRLRLALLASLSILAASPALAQTAYESVDPFIGTGGDGHTFPGAVVPFGMVQLSPDTEILPFKQSYARAAGDLVGDPTILGFSHTHFSGAGHADLGDIRLTPVSGEARLEPGEVVARYHVIGQQRCVQREQRPRVGVERTAFK